MDNDVLMNRLAGVFGTVVFASMGVFWFRASRAYQRLSRQAARWPTVQGIIVRSEVGLRPTNAGDAQRNEANRLVGEAEYPRNEIPVVVYEFVVEGRSYRGQRFNSLASSLDEALAMYPKHKAVTVHYRPENPADCFVDPLGPGVEKTGRYGAFGLVFFCLAAVVPLLVALGVISLPH